MMLTFFKQYWPGLLGVLLLAAVFGAGSSWGIYKTDSAWKLRWKQRDADDAGVLAKRQADARAEEQRRQGEIDDIWKRAEGQIAEVVADADRARAVSDGLQRETAKLTARLAASERACRATTTSPGEAGATGIDLLAELFRRADKRAGDLAAIADRARVRGLTCEASYDVNVRRK